LLSGMTSAVYARAMGDYAVHAWGLPSELDVDGERHREPTDEPFESVLSCCQEDAWPPATLHVSDLDLTQKEELWSSSNGEMKAIFLDYDGTLREFEERPEMAKPTEEIQALLTALCARQDLLVHIISGRDADFLNTHFGVHERLTLIAEHERRVAGRFQIWCSAGAGDWKTLVRPAIEKFVECTCGSFQEEKSSALVWHFRGVADQALGEYMARVLVELVERLREEHGGPLQGVKVSLGHKTVEVSSRGVSKGEIMRHICQEHEAKHGPFGAVLAAGDDQSDESMFASAPQDFFTVKVGAEPTGARYCVDNPEQLRALLWHVASL